MRIQTRTAVGILALLVSGALACTPAVPQQGGPDDAPPPPPISSGTGPGGPGMSTGRVEVRVERRQGGGFSGWARGMGMDDGMGFGIGLGRFGASGLLMRAERALRDPQIRQQLGFSDEQANKLEQQITDFRKTMIQNRANLEIQRIDLRSLLAADNPDRAAVDNKLKQVGAAQLALEKSAVDFAVTLKQQVTPEQREKIRQFLRERGLGGMRDGGRAVPRYRRGPRGGAQQGAQPNAQPQPDQPGQPQ